VPHGTLPSVYECGDETSSRMFSLTGENGIHAATSAKSACARAEAHDLENVGFTSGITRFRNARQFLVWGLSRRMRCVRLGVDDFAGMLGSERQALCNDFCGAEISPGIYGGD